MCSARRGAVTTLNIISTTSWLRSLRRRATPEMLSQETKCLLLAPANATSDRFAIVRMQF